MFTEPVHGAQRVALVGCSARKLSRGAPARSFYTSGLFRAALAYATATCDAVRVVSALHGAVELDTWIEPYNRNLRKLRKAEREAWGVRTVAEVLGKDKPPRPVLVILAGQLYADALVHGAHWHNLPRPEEPLRGIKGCGARIAWLQERTPKAPPMCTTSGERAFVQRLHNDYSEAVCRTLLSLGFRNWELDDLLQDVFLVALRRAASIPADAGPWLVNTTRKLAANYRRRHRHRLEELDPEAAMSEPGEPELSELVRQALEELDEEDRELFVRHYLNGESVAQLEKAVGSKRGAIYARLRGARERIRMSVSPPL